MVSALGGFQDWFLLTAVVCSSVPVPTPVILFPYVTESCSVSLMAFENYLCRLSEALGEDTNIQSLSDFAFSIILCSLSCNSCISISSRGLPW